MIFTVYILYAAGIDKYYIGFTKGEIEERFRKHLSNHAGFTSKSKQWKIVYTELFYNKVYAMKREREIKNWKSRKRIEQLLRQK